MCRPPAAGSASSRPLSEAVVSRFIGQVATFPLGERVARGGGGGRKHEK